MGKTIHDIKLVVTGRAGILKIEIEVDLPISERRHCDW